MFRYCFIFFVVAYFVARTSFAQQAFQYGIHHQFESTRAMGMGNAFVAIADDENAIFYNPAGLRQLKEGKMNFFIKGAVDPEIPDLLDDIDKAGDAVDETQAFLNLINANLNNNYGLRAPSLGMLWARPRWAMAAILADVTADISFQRVGVPNVDVKAYQDTTLAYARAWDIRTKSGKLSWGVTGKLINRAFIDRRLDAATLVANDDILDESLAQEGLTLDFDIGALWRWQRPISGFWRHFEPSAGFVVRNVLDYGYLTNAKLLTDVDSGDPEDLQRRIDIGGAVKLPQWWIWDTTLAVDFKDILHDNWTFRKSYHVGLEFLWEMASWWKGGWRVGLNQGHFTAGFSGQIWKFKLDLATYTNEIGTSSNQNESRLYMFTTSLDF